LTSAWLIWGSDAALVAAVALVLAIGPQGLLQQVTGERATWRRALGVAGPAAVAGFACLSWFAWLHLPLLAGPLAAAAVTLVAVMVVDGRWLVIPDVYVAALALLGLAGASRIGWTSALIGLALGGGLLAAVRWAFLRWRRVEGLGFGDVKLMAAVGLLVGEDVLWVIVAASALGAGWLLFSRSATETRLLAPFGACAAVPAFAMLAARTLLGSGPAL
jgi:leader peptidase (prepilin peptidase)/N-methyltransferase